MNLLQLQFDLPLHHADLPAFRGAFAAFAGLEHDVFHNHDNDRDSQRDYLHRYPLVQYRVHEGMAAVLGINAGAEALETLLRQDQFAGFSMNGRHLPLRLRQRTCERGPMLELLPETDPRRYRIYHYLPFTPENYTAYKGLGSLTEKVHMLERLLQNHVVAMARGTGCDLPSLPPLKVVLQDIDRVKKVNALGMPMMAFDLVFSLNARLPEGISLGRKVAFGFGFCIGLDGRLPRRLP